MNPIDILKRAVASYEPYLQPSGEIIDPIIRQPTQYGTAYHALCQAVVALKGDPASREAHLQRAQSGLDAALKRMGDPALPGNVSGMDRETGQVWRLNHRDFFWPPILKTYRIIKQLDPSGAAAFADRIAAVDLLGAVRARPPSNWAMVWLSGEWMRYKEGLSPFDLGQIDAWLGIFFENHILLDQGLYQEPGHPNSYDLFTRYHLADMLLDGYNGSWQASLEALMDSGFTRSLQVQLSDGSLASAHRSTGQSWTVGIQCAYFSLVASYFRDRQKDDSAQPADAAARRAFASFVRWQRPHGPYSPVENLLPPAYRVGYESYTADGHYGNLAMGFLAAAILAGFDNSGPAELPSRETATFIESDPTFRALAHLGDYSVHANGFPAQTYDAFGLVDISFGPGRRFHFVSSVRHLESGNLYNIGLALRSEAGLSVLTVVARQEPALIGQIEPGEKAPGFLLRARAKGSPYLYQLDLSIDSDGIRVQEKTPKLNGFKTLLIPYLRDGGWADKTKIEIDQTTIRFILGSEVIRLELAEQVEQVLDLPYGFENRRGLCGLLRIDFAEPCEAIGYRFAIEA